MNDIHSNKIKYSGRRIPFKLFAVIAALFGILVIVYAVNAKLVLPTSYYLDEAIFAGYQHLSQPCDPLAGIRDPFICTSNVYKFIGVGQDLAPWLAGLFVAALFFFVPVFSGKYRDAHFGVYSTFIVLTVVWAFVAASFNSGLSKELLALFALLFAAIFSARGKFALTLMIFLIYAIYIRSYWVLLLPGTCFVWFTFAKLSFNKAILASILIAVGISVVYFVIFGVSIESIRQASNDGRTVQSASEITAMMPDTNLVLGAANIFLIWISLVFPFKLLMLGSPQHVIVAFLMAITVIFLYRAGRRLKYSQDNIGQFCLSILMTFLAIQALFEPDYGSFVRHISDFMPFGLIAIYRSYRPMTEGAHR